MDNRFLITYSVPSTEYSGRINLFQWEDSDGDVKAFLNEKKDIYGAAFQIIEVIEIVESREFDLVALFRNSDVNITGRDLLSKGFKKVKCEDGIFFVIQEGNTDLGNKIAKLSQLPYNSGYDGYVDDKIIIQSNLSIDKFEVYCDGESWDLSLEEFKNIIKQL